MFLFADDTTGVVSLQQGLFGAGVGLLVLFGERLKQVLGKLFDRLTDRIEHGKPQETVRERQAATMREILRSHEVMQSALDLPFVSRVLMFEGSNGGSIPRPGKLYGIRAIGCIAMRNSDKTRRLYEGPLPLDATYSKILLEIIEHGQTVATREELPANSILRSLYQEEGVTQSALFWLGSDEKMLTFLSVANYERAFTEAEIAQLGGFVIRLRGLMGSTITIPEPTP